MSAPIPQPATRTCCTCSSAKPLTVEFFEQRKRDNSNVLLFRTQCRACRRAHKRQAITLVKTKRCTSCLDYLPLADFDAGDDGATRSRCRDCFQLRGLIGANPGRTRARHVGEEPAYERGPKPCVACHDMPWRVLGPRCPCCKLMYALEPRPELELRRTR